MLCIAKCILFLNHIYFHICTSIIPVRNNSKSIRPILCNILDTWALLMSYEIIIVTCHCLLINNTPTNLQAANNTYELTEIVVILSCYIKYFPLLLLLLLTSLFIGRSMYLCKIICISSLCAIDKLPFLFYSIFSFLLYQFTFIFHRRPSYYIYVSVL